MGKHKKNIHMVTFILLVIGGLNWLLIGLFDLNLVENFGENIERIVYILIGASAVYEFAMHKASCKMCGGMSESSSSESQQSSM